MKIKQTADFSESRSFLKIYKKKTARTPEIRHLCEDFEPKYVPEDLKPAQTVPIEGCQGKPKTKPKRTPKRNQKERRKAPYKVFPFHMPQGGKLCWAAPSCSGAGDVVRTPLGVGSNAILPQGNRRASFLASGTCTSASKAMFATLLPRCCHTPARGSENDPPP